MTARCWCQRPAHGSCGCCCAEHDQAPPPVFQVFGVDVPASVARTADDGVTVFEPAGPPVTRWRTETARSPRRDRVGDRPPYLDIEEANRRDAANDLSSPPASYDQTKRRVL